MLTEKTQREYESKKRRREERRARVKTALKQAGTVPFSLRTLIEDGHSPSVIRLVWRRGEES